MRSISNGTPPRAGPSPRAKASPIQRVVVVLQENHTFDNYFGTYPNADGLLGQNICLPQSPGSTQCVKPYHNPSLTPASMAHDWKTAHAAHDGGKMDGFVYAEGKPDTMAFYDRADVPRYWSAADQYVLCDRYFTSAMTESAPNHLFLVAGTNGGILDDAVPPTLNFPPIFQQLDEHGISWKVYGFTTWYERFAYVQNTPSARSKFVPSTHFAQWDPLESTCRHASLSIL